MIRTISYALLLFALIAPVNFARAEDAALDPGANAKAEVKADDKKADEKPAAKSEAKEEKKPADKAPEKTADKKEDAKAGDATDAAPAEDEVPPGVKAHQQAAEEVFSLTKEIVKDITPEEQKHFFLLYNNYNLLGTVKMVQGDVGKAVDSCGKENPEMKDGLDQRFKEWNAAVNPVMKDAEGNINNMVLAQDYAKPDKIKQVFKGLDKTRKLANAQIEKTPVTTKDACEYLQEKMSDTQENFVQLLRSTLISAPQAMPTDEPAKKVEADKKPEAQEAAKDNAKPDEEKSAANPPADSGAGTDEKKD